MNAPRRVSVVIPCFNHGEFLPEAAASVLDLKRDDTELVIINDGSTDERTCREVGRLEARGVRVIHQENKGLAAARNAGLVVSEGQYVLPLDADNRLRPGYIEHGIETLDNNPQVGVVYGDAQYIGIRTGLWHVGPFNRTLLLEANYIDACAMYRRSVWEQNGGYDGTMPVQGLEDWDFWLGALEHGWEFAYVPEVLFDYRVAKESMITRAAGFEGQIQEFVARKHGRLYRQAWQQLHASVNRDRESVKATFRNLRRLLASRLRQKLQTDKSNGRKSG